MGVLGRFGGYLFMSGISLVLTIAISFLWTTTTGATAAMLVISLSPTTWGSSGAPWGFLVYLIIPSSGEQVVHNAGYSPGGFGCGGLPW